MSSNAQARRKATQVAEKESDNAKEEAQKSMLQQAHELVYGQRQVDYGPAKENLQNIADLWSVILGIPVTTDQVALCMIQVKVARLIRSPHHADSWVDIAGYVGVKDKMNNGM